MRNVLPIILILGLTLLAIMGCVDSKYKTRNEMTPEEIEEIENVYNPNPVNPIEEVIPPFLEGFEGPALRVNGLDIQASELRDLYRHYITFQHRDPELAKGLAIQEFVRVYAAASQFADTIEASKTRLEEIRDKVNSGEVDFTSMVVENSQEPDAATTGGELGDIYKDSMVPNFEMHAFNDPIGQVCGPFPTMFGWHLIFVEERKNMDTDTASAKVRHLLLYHGLNPENANRLDNISVTRWANTSNIDVLVDSLIPFVIDYYPHMAEKLLGLTSEETAPSETGSSQNSTSNTPELSPSSQ